MHRLLRLAFAPALIVCSQWASSNVSAEETIKIDAVLALSGPASVYGVPAEKALRLMIDNLPGKLLVGRKVEFEVYDSEGNSTKAVQLFRRAVESDHADVIFGPATSGESLAVGPVANQLKVPMISHGGAEPITKPVTPYVFCLAPTDRMMIEAVLASIKKHGWKKVAILHSMDGFGQSGGTIAQEVAPAEGFELTAVESFGAGDSDMTPQLLRIREKNPDAIILWSTNPGPTIVLRNALDMGYKTPFFVSTANATLGFINQTGVAAEGVYSATLPIVAPEALADGDPRKAVLLAFNKQYSDRYGQPADQTSGHGLDDILILQEALKNIKGALTPESLRDAIETVKMCGANGCRQLRPDDHRGVTPDAIAVMRIKDGKFGPSE